VLDLRARSPGRTTPAAGPPCRTTPAAAPPGRTTSPAPCVVLVSRQADAEVTAVHRLLAAAGVPVLRIDAESIAAAELVADPAAGTLRAGGPPVRPTVTWVRHFSGRTVTGPATTARRAFAADSWHAVADQLAALSAVTIAPRGPALLGQLGIASGLGIPVPRTVVAADPALAAPLLGTSRVVIKALGDHFTEVRPGVLHGTFAEIADRAQLRPGRWQGGPPVAVQEFVEHDREVRAYYAGGAVVTFTVAKASPAEPWLHPERVGAALTDPPPAVMAATTALAAAMDLRFGAFDFLIAGGRPVFLEVSPAGDWRWLEARAGSTAVTMAVASMLRDLHDLAATGPGGRPARAPLALTAFLAGGRSARCGNTGKEHDQL